MKINPLDNTGQYRNISNFARQDFFAASIASALAPLQSDVFFGSKPVIPDERKLTIADYKAAKKAQTKRSLCDNPIAVRFAQENVDMGKGLKRL